MKNLQISITRASWDKDRAEKIPHYEPVLRGTIKNKNGTDVPVTVSFEEEYFDREDADKRATELLESFV